MLNHKKVQEIINRYEDGDKLTRKEQIFYRSEKGTRKSNLVYILSSIEMQEYIKCHNDPIYFIEAYCGLVLRDYQREWITNFADNRFSINCCSDEMGFNTVMSALYLWYSTLFKDQSILIVPNKRDEGVEFIDLIWTYYKHLPFFLKGGIIFKNQKSMRFDNGNMIKSNTSKYAGVGRNWDIISYLDFAHIPESRSNYTCMFPVLSTRVDGRINLKSAPNGNNLFKELVENSELKEGHPDKNRYSTIKTYWWEVEERDEEWKQNKISEISQKAFDQHYNIKFV